MRLINLFAINFKQYKKLGPIKFPEQGVIGIAGNNGSGKSTVFSAIEVALFGKDSNTKMSELKFSGSKKSDKWEIHLTFLFNGIEYTVKRHETSSKAELIADGTQIQVGQTAVNEHIEKEVLRMNQDAFLNAFYAKQDDVDKLSEMKNEERKREISSLLGIDDIDKAIKLSRKDKNELNIKITELKKHIKNDDELTKLIDKKKKELNTNDESIIKLNEMLSKLNKDIITNEKVISDKEKIKDKFNEKKYILVQKENELEHKISKMNVLTKELKELELLKEKVEKYTIELKEFDSINNWIESAKQHLSLVDYLNDLKEKIVKQKKKIDSIVNKTKDISKDSLLKKVSDNKEKLNNINKTKNSLLIEMNTIKNELDQLKLDGKNLRDNLNGIKKLGGTSNCPTCKQELGENLKVIINDYESKIEELLIKYKEKELILKNMNQDFNDITEKEHEINLEIVNTEEIINNNEKNFIELETERGIFSRQKEEYVNFTNSDSGKLLEKNMDKYNKGELKIMEEKINHLLEKRSFVNHSKERLKKIDDLISETNTINKDIEPLNNNINSIKEELKEFKFDQQDLDDLKMLFNKLKSEEEEVLESKNKLSLTSTRLQGELSSLEKDKVENDEKIETLSERTNKFKELVYLDEAFKKFKILKLSEISPTLSKIMSSLMDYMTDGKYDKVTLDENYNIFVNRNGIDQPYHMFSGGEKKLISLVQRLAISQIITRQRSTNNFEFLALDEVVGSFDSNKQFVVLESLQRINSIFKQIFMITHNQELNSMFDYTLQVKQNPDLSSNIEWLH